MVHRTEFISCNQQNWTLQSGNDCRHGVVGSERNQKAAGTLNQEHVGSGRKKVNPINHILQSDRFPLCPRRSRGDGELKVKRIDLIKGQLAVLSLMQDFHIIPTAGAKGLRGQGVATIAPQVYQGQRGEERFSHPGVGPGDEEELAH